MRRTTFSQFARDPVGHFLGGETWAHYCAHPGLWGFILWGRPTEAHALALGKSLVLELEPPAVPHASIVDCRQLQGGDDGAFSALERYVTKYGDKLSRSVTLQALVRPPGLRGTIVSGAFEVLPRPFPVRVFDDLLSALEWVKPATRGGAPLALQREIDSVIEQATGTSVELGNLRGLLDTAGQRLSIAEAARTLGLSARTLQRKLKESRTTFQREVGLSMVRAAQRLLVEADAPLTTIALEAGFSSLQHLNTQFKKLTGTSPANWRQRQTSART
jgi:AraC-like DNA-binding protein